MAVIELLLATHDSEAFLPELLDSLFAQTCQEFTILVADDASSDGTLAIVERWSQSHPGRIRLVARHQRRLGILGNFASLFACATADYLMPCDHDDIWLPDKIAMTLQRMRELEAGHSAETPLLVHTDLTVVSEDLEVLGPSFFRFSGIDPARNALSDLLLANVATGCTTMVNRPLYRLARPIPPEAIMYDHWLALVAAATGAISYIDEPTILYRQHGGNAIGAKAANTMSLIGRIRQTLFSRERQLVLLRYSRQAEALHRRFAAKMRPEARQATEALAHLWSTSRWRRFSRLRDAGLGLGGLGFARLLRKVALWVVVTRRGPPRVDPRLRA
jgi:hypothetical protein